MNCYINTSKNSIFFLFKVGSIYKDHIFTAYFDGVHILGYVSDNLKDKDIQTLLSYITSPIRAKQECFLVQQAMSISSSALQAMEFGFYSLDIGKALEGKKKTCAGLAKKFF